MIRKQPNSILHSIKGRIWLAVSALAVLNCVFGLGAYLAVSFLVTDAFVTIFVTFFVLSFVTLVFGWWLSNEIIRPIDSVTLLAKSLERSPSATLPSTTGAAETDELLHTLHRGGQQMRNLIAVMDDVAAGKVDSALAPIEGGDKLSASFQKLVAKVTDSISAKQDLDSIQGSLSALAADVVNIRNGKLDVNIRGEVGQTKDIAETLRFLTSRLRSLAIQVQAGSLQAEQAAKEARSSLQSAIEASDVRTAIASQNSIRYFAENGGFEVLIREFESDLAAARGLQNGVGQHGVSASGSIDRAAQMRGRVSETAKKVQKLRTRSLAFSQLARVAQELSKRSGLISLNMSVGSGDAGGSVGVLAGEIASLSDRAGDLQKQIAASNESLNGEIAEIENDLAAIARDMPDLVRLATSSVQANQEFSAIIDRLSGLEQRFKAATEAHSLETDKIVGLFEKVSDTTATNGLLRDSEIGIQRVIGTAESLRESISDLKLPVNTRSAPQAQNAIVPEQTVLEPLPAVGEVS